MVRARCARRVFSLDLGAIMLTLLFRILRLPSGAGVEDTAEGAAPKQEAVARKSGAARRISLVLLSAVVLFVVLELALQVRSQVRFGQSIFNLAKGQTRYIQDPVTGLKLLRPASVLPGSEVEIRTNSLGLRSPEVTPARLPGSLRIAVVGASTVMGEMARSNEATFSALLHERLQKHYPDRKVEVINAGIAGYRLADQLSMLKQIVLPLKPDLVVVYPGFNDFADYCKAGKAPAASSREGLPLLTLPNWLLSVDAVRKKTVALRSAPPMPGKRLDPASIDLLPYRQRLEGLVSAARGAGVDLVLATNARAYRAEQPLDVQMRLSEQARYFNPCFDLPGLNTLYDRHNSEIVQTARRMDVPVLRLDQRIPGGQRYFVDASHFTLAGEELAADEIYGFLLDQHLAGS